MTAILPFIGAAIAEIAGCFAFWAWLGMGKSPLWILPGILSLVLFAYLLTLPKAQQPDELTPPMVASNPGIACVALGC
ncbi:drug/metabolite transporter superfamily protein YnfA [Phyllobacterium myrsinacearum]|uniref:Drug/metabolite transporter superfamily protein YnfA n=1 Tax=Phyllobacterium myrsinacearum TaxID=28101 RepID=A0A839EPZ2_9HYPH|nr:drug/metabolite transporter superfamily protein YnfA [Phyllobacterium myrsinacearum]